tara:strand:+ start:143 stop:991 length:849 start_codon:yes stop_codon:yes gene_type:complete
MPIEIPENGKPIDRADIQDMFDSVKNNVNNLEKDNIARSAFGPGHFKPADAASSALTVFPWGDKDGGVVTAFDSVSRDPDQGFAVNSSVSGTGFIDPNDTGTEPNDWMEFTSLTLDNGGNGYYLLPGWVIVYFSLRIKNLAGPASPGLDPADYNSQCLWWTVACGTYTRTKMSGGSPVAQETVVRTTIGGCRVDNMNEASGMTSSYHPMWNKAHTQEQNISCWYAIDTRDMVDPDIAQGERVLLNSLKVRLSRSRSNGATIDSGSLYPWIRGAHHQFFSIKA